MQIDESGEKIAEEIVKIFEAKDCTVEQANEILDFVKKYISNHAKVQFGGMFFSIIKG